MKLLTLFDFGLPFELFWDLPQSKFSSLNFYAFFPQRRLGHLQREFTRELVFLRQPISIFVFRRIRDTRPIGEARSWSRRKGSFRSRSYRFYVKFFRSLAKLEPAIPCRVKQLSGQRWIRRALLGHLRCTISAKIYLWRNHCRSILVLFPGKENLVSPSSTRIEC